MHGGNARPRRCAGLLATELHLFRGHAQGLTEEGWAASGVVTGGAGEGQRQRQRQRSKFSGGIRNHLAITLRGIKFGLMSWENGARLLLLERLVTEQNPYNHRGID